MPPSPAELKEKLLNAIDEEHNITNYDLLLEVIDRLEQTALTREDLETTRIGRYINEVRKKAPNELGKRLRKLVKSWQALANSTPSNNASPASGYSPALGYANSPGLPTFTHSVASPLLSGRSSKSPALQSNRGRLVSPAINDSRSRLSSPSIADHKGKLASPGLSDRARVPAILPHDHKAKLVSSVNKDSAQHRLASPLVRQQDGRDSPAHLNSKRISPSYFKPATPRNVTTPFSKSSQSRPDTPNGRNHKLDNVGTRTPTPPHLNNHVHVTPNIDSTHRAHAANKKRRRSDESCTSDGSSIKKTRHVVNGESSRIGERIRTPKVKTTVEIIAELQAGKSAPLTDSDTITKIVTNQIQKEQDDIHRSVVPSSAMPKSRRKHGASSLPDPPSARADLSKTKSDLVHRFLHQQQHQRHSNMDNDDLPYDGVDFPSTTTSSGPDMKLSAPPTINTSVNPYSLLPPIDYERIKWEDAQYEDEAIVRNAITGEYPDGYDPDSDESSDQHYDDPRIERVINKNWHGVNGTASENSQFHPWTETFTISSSQDSPDNASVILPYVDI